MVRQTSLDTYYQIKDNGMLSNMRLKTYGLLFEYGAMTANELMDIAKGEYPTMSHQTIESLGRRLSELRDLGCIKEVGVVECSITKRQCIQWEVNGELPVKREKPKTNKERMKIASILIGDYMENRAAFDNLKEALNVLGGQNV